MTHRDAANSDIVVGVDGSDASTTALRWAAVEAQLRNTGLKVVTVYGLTWAPDEASGLGDLTDLVRQQSEAIVAAAVAEARALAPQVEVSGATTLGHPVTELVRASRSVGMVVLGNRGRGGFASLLLGSVSQQVATHAIGSVVVVRGRPDPRGWPVVVGVDDAPSAQRVLELAFQYAQHHDCALTAVRAVSLPIPPRGADTPPLLYDQDAVRQAAATELNTLLAPLRDTYPTVAARAVVGTGSPAGHLVGLSSHATLVIVGSRGHGAVVGTLLGSVGLQLLHHADCPVMIVHTSGDVGPSSQAA